MGIGWIDCFFRQICNALVLEIGLSQHSQVTRGDDWSFVSPAKMRSVALDDSFVTATIYLFKNHVEFPMLMQTSSSASDAASPPAYFAMVRFNTMQNVIKGSYAKLENSKMNGHRNM